MGGKKRGGKRPSTGASGKVQGKSKKSRKEKQSSASGCSFLNVESMAPGKRTSCKTLETNEADLDRDDPGLISHSQSSSTGSTHR